MKKIFAFIAFAITALCSTPAFAMAVKKRSADEIEQEDSYQSSSPFATPVAGSPNILAAPSSQQTKPAEGGDWNARVARTLLLSEESSSESIEYPGIELVEIVPETPAAPHNNDEFEEEFEKAFAGMDEAL
jgi:hypothetical protein